MKLSTRLIGLFVLGALALAVTLTLLFARGHFLSPARQYVAYFQGSVNGLNVGALVKLKGVAIGRVTDIRVQYDLAHNRVLTPVIAEIDLGKITDIDTAQHAAQANLQELIDRGLRARLSQTSLVTGQLYLDLNFFPDRPVMLVGADPELPELPTIPSGKEEIEDGLREVVTEVRDLPLKETFAATLNSVRRIEQLLAAPETQASIGHLNRSLEDIGHLVRHVDGKVDGLAGRVDGTLQDSQMLIHTLNDRLAPALTALERTLTATTATATEAQGTLASLRDIAEPESELNRALREVAAAARAVRFLADSLERHPEALLQGRRNSDSR